MKKIKLILSIILVLFSLAFVIYAQDDFGYVVKIKPNTQMFSAMLLGDADVTEIPDTAVETAQFLLENVDGVEDSYYKHGYVSVNDKETVDMLMSLGVVEYAEENAIAELYGYVAEDNTDYANQWGYNAVKASYALNSGVLGDEIRVGVIDSGIYPHDDLKGVIAEGYNFVSDDNNTVDIYGHGTNVAGVIAAQPNNIGVIGIAPRVTLVPIKVTNEGSFSAEMIHKAIRMAVDDFDCDVINMSLGTTVTSTSLREAVDYATGKGVILVAASGNKDGNAYEARYPAAYPRVISVGNVTRENNTFKIYRSSVTHSSLNIAAPGHYIRTTNINNGYKYVTGTSFACPMVAAAAALVKQINKEADCVDFIAEYIPETANASYMTDQQNADYWGSGLLDIDALLKYVLSQKSVHVSSIDFTYNTQNAFVYIHNPKSTPLEYTVEITADYPKTSSFSLAVEGYSTREVSLTQLGVLGEATVNVYMNDAPETLVATTSKQLFQPKNTYKIVNADNTNVSVLRQRAAQYDACLYISLHSAEGKLKEIKTVDIAMNDLEAGVAAEFTTEFASFEETDIIKAMVLDINSRPVAFAWN